MLANIFVLSTNRPMYFDKGSNNVHSIFVLYHGTYQQRQFQVHAIKELNL